MTGAGRLALALLVALAGGGLFALAGLPAAWLSGAMAATAIAALCGLSAPVPEGLRRLVYILLGTTMGAGVTPDVLAGIGTWPASLAGLSVTVAAMTAGSVLVLTRLAGWDRATAFFASIPGALTMTLAVAEESRADLARVSLAQTLRLFMLVAMLPLAVAAAGGGGPPGPGVGVIDETGEALMLAAAALAGAGLGHLLRVPAGLLLGAFLGSGILHGAGLVAGQLPALVEAPALAALGCVLGLRFAGTRLSAVLGTLAASLAAFLGALALAAAGAFAVAALTGLPAAEVLVAFAPGGLEAMVILAFALDLDPTFVAAHHLARFLAMTLLVPFLAPLVLGRDWTRR